MKNFIFLTLAGLAIVACERQDKPSSTYQRARDNDNTAINIRNRDSSNVNPGDQSENEIDRTITQKIRQAIMADDALSMNAKNIQIITINGVVTLRGPVANENEKEAIAKKIREIKGITRVENRLEVTNENQ